MTAPRPRDAAANSGRCRISVVIPTRNRQDILWRCLDALEAQTLSPSSFEVLVVDDGSDDDTAARTRERGHSPRLALRLLHQDRRGPAAARNLAIARARGTLLLFVNDDVIPTPTLLAQHDRWHRERSDITDAMLGLVVTHSEIASTPFSNWLEASGAHFDYASLEDGAEVNPGRHFYTANVSVKRVFLEQNRSRFDERFSDPAWEDIDFGSRLARQGLRLYLNRAAVGEHLHGMSVAQWTRRMTMVGASSLCSAPQPHVADVILAVAREVSFAAAFAPFYWLARVAEHRWPLSLAFRGASQFGAHLGLLRTYLAQLRHGLTR